VIHYSCESFYDWERRSSPRITSVAVRRLDSGQTNSFSIHQVAERNSELDLIDSDYDKLERQMLEEFYDFVGRHDEYRWLHWNMRDINFGFTALEHRIRVLGGEPTTIADDQKFDLARVLVDIYGVGYTGHPRLETLLQKNKIIPLNFMTGAQEAAAFKARNYVGLHQSTLRKVDVIANIAGRAHDRTLMTNTPWWDQHGGSVKGFVDWINANPVWTLVVGVAGIAGLIVGVLALRGPTAASTPVSSGIQNASRDAALSGLAPSANLSGTGVAPPPKK
jgi:hypothetical protein